MFSCSKTSSFTHFIHHSKRFGIVDTLPRHLLPKPPHIRAQQISAKNVLHPNYRNQADINPFIHRSHLNERQRYEQPLAVRLSNKLKISKDKISKILSDHPRLCQNEDSEKEIDEICNYLSRTFGGDTFMRTMIMRQPLILESDIGYLQYQIHSISNHLCDDTMNEQFAMHLMRKQPDILVQDLESEIIPKIHFLKDSLSSFECMQCLMNVSAIIIMSFHRLIRILFIRQKQNEKSITLKLSKMQNVNRQNLEFVKKYLQNGDEICLFHILQLQPTAMIKVFKDYNDWIHAQIEENYYLHPVIEEEEMQNIKALDGYSEPILNLIDDMDENVQMIEGKTSNDFKRQKHNKTVRQMEILVGKIHKANTIRNAMFR